ncbi:DUF397 domain-containing protein [Embleya scabrispora]|uniref:DUF397 domain-containing protein n=1 Tax=Embleya scabrispora TaxID=159449 RepID=A0A1T3NXH4_9ACTN|nr:DUF397 domain-containing protein [Embleya scabrispora]OPC81350.1 DUF397 domain-containing protein [Embleya scabrispora]
MRATPGTGATAWRKSSYSNGDQGNCVEVRDDLPGFVPVRDSKDPGLGHLNIAAGPWAAFVHALRG